MVVGTIYRADIPIGKENAITTHELAELKNLPERQVKKAIASLRRTESDDGYIIVSSTKKAGYWRTDDNVEVSEYMHQMEARAKSTFLALREARRLLAEKNDHAAP